MQARLRRMDVGHRGQRGTRAVPRSLFIIFTAFFFLLSFCTSAFHQTAQLHTLDFPQTSATSGHRTNSASGLLLNGLSSDNRSHVEGATEKVFQNKLQMKHLSKVKMLKWPSDKLHYMLIERGDSKFLQRSVRKNINMCHIRHSSFPLELA